MKKSFIIAAVLSFIWSAAPAREVVDLITMLPVAPTTSTAPERTVETLDDGVLVTYSFRYVAVDSAAYAPGTCIYSFDGFGTSDLPEFPALPTHADFIEVPVMGASTLSIESIEHVSFISEIAPALEPMVETSTPKDPLPIRAYAGFYPQEQVSVSDEVNHRTRKALMLSVNPISYNAETQEVRIATSVTYKVNFPSGSLYGARSRARAIDAPADDSPVFDNMILNSTASTDDDPTETKDVTADYLIITTDKMMSAVADFATWKRQLGFRVHISSRDKWHSDSEVKDSIDKYYEETPNLKYLLIVGSHKNVPAIVIKYYDSTKAKDSVYVTDFYYACVNTQHSFTLSPALYNGRIPATSVNEATAALLKIKDYESVCTHQEGMFNRRLFCAYFEDNNNDGVTERRFVQTSEELVNNTITNGYDITRVYCTKSSATPTHYSNNLELPDELRGEFNWKGNSDNIKNALAEGTGCVVYHGHGSNSGWVCPYYQTNNISTENYGHKLGISLTNTKSYKWIFPVVFNFTCSSGEFNQSGNFAKNSITKENGGSSCIFAASSYSYGNYDDIMSLGIFDSFSETPMQSDFSYFKSTDRDKRKIYRMGNYYGKDYLKQRIILLFIYSIIIKYTIALGILV